MELVFVLLPNTHFLQLLYSLAQGKAEQDRVAEMVHEMSKPLARGKDDADRDSYLKDIDREGDPMLEFMKKKKDKKNKGPSE